MILPDPGSDLREYLLPHLRLLSRLRGFQALQAFNNGPEAEFMNVQFRWGFWAQSGEFSDLRFPYTILKLQTSFKPLLLGGGGGGGVKILVG